MHDVAEFQAAFKVKGAKRASLNISAATARNIAENLDWQKMAMIAIHIGLQMGGMGWNCQRNCVYKDGAPRGT